MPELPEVETVCRSLRPHLLGRTINRVRVLEPRLRDAGRMRRRSNLWRESESRPSARVAKYILLHLSDDVVWLFHLGMSGKLICVEPNMARRKHDHIIVELDNGAELRYHDPRRFGLSLVAKKDGLRELPQLRHVGS